MSYVNRAKDSEASTNVGAIFTDETAFNATNSFYISAGTASAPTTAPAAGAITSTHGFYDTALTAGGGIYYVDTPPYECVGGSVETYGGYTKEPAGTVHNAGTTLGPVTATTAGGFGDIGFYPKGTLYFYYMVTTPTAAASTAVPASLTTPTFAPGVNGTCGGGYEAEAWTNLTGSNLQAYAVNDFTSSPVLVAGTSY